MSLADKLRAALAEGDRRTPELLAGDGFELEDGLAATPAAVLVPVVDRPAPGLILTLRPQSMRNHAGQVSFPGGRIDPGDADPVAAALREAEEEIGLAPAAVNVIGIADRYRTGSGFEIVPVLGVITPDLPLTPSPGEVEAVFEVPLHYLLDPANLRTGQAEWRGQTRCYYEIIWNDRRIWGATAAMIVNLSRRLALAL